MNHTHEKPLSLGCYVEKLLAERTENWSALARTTGLSETTLAELAAGERMLTGDIAILFAGHFEVSPIVFLDVQRQYHLTIGEEVVSEFLAAA